MNAPLGLKPVHAVEVALGTAFTLDQLFGVRTSATRRSNPEFYTARPDGARHTLGVLPGCQSDGKLFFDNLLPRTPDTTLVAVDYPKHGFNIEAICEGLAKHLIAARAERPSLLCQSMGGIVMRHFLEYAQATGATEQLGGFSNIVLDSSPYDQRDVKTPYKLLLDAAAVGHTSWTADRVKRLFNRPGVNIDTIHGQGGFIRANHPSGPLPDVMDALYYIQGPSDNVISTEQAAAKYQHISPTGKFQLITDLARPEHSHTADIPRYDFELRYVGIQLPDQLAA